MKLVRTILFPIALLLALPICAADQYDEPHGDDSHHYVDEADVNTIVAPLVLPTADDFAPEDAGDAESGDGATGPADKSLASNAGVATYFEVTSKQKAGLLTPFWKFNPNFKVKARIPLIWNRTQEYQNHDATNSGIGDITFEGEYKRFCRRLNGLMGFQLSLKAPTGDDEPGNDDDNYPKPALGTGTWDYVGRATYARSTPTSGLVASVLYRKSGSSETETQAGTWIYTNETTSGSQKVLSTFYRHRINSKLWWCLGASLALLGDGEWTNTSKDTTTGNETTNDGDLDTSGKMLDLYPGISYQMGPIAPFIGLRIPVMTSYDADNVDEDRDAALIVQFTYNPGSMGS